MTQGAFLSLTLPADLNFSAGVRDFVSEFAKYYQFPSYLGNQLKLIVDELFMNAILYGSEKNSTVVLKLSYQDNKLKGSMEDFGKEGKKITAENLRKIIVEQTNNNVITKRSGRGLAQIITPWIEQIEIENNAFGGLRIAFEKTINLTSLPPIIEKKTLLNLSPQLKEFSFVFKDREINQKNISAYQTQVDNLIESNQGIYRLIFDLTKVHYCNSAFIGLVAKWYNQLKEREGELVFLNPTPEVLDIFNLVGLTKIIPIKQITT